eukprot:scaffold13442_cov96-Skeletonema_dohrnii-CCMP3373.AAC.3
MVTLIRTLKRISKSTPSNEPNESPQTKKPATSVAQLSLYSHAHHDGQLKKTETATDAIEMSKKERASSDNTSSPQKTLDTADTPDEKSAAVKSNTKSPQSDRKRKASTHEELGPMKVARYKYKRICSANGCTNMVVKGGVCVRHGAKVKRKLCSREGCTNIAIKGGVCTRHGAQTHHVINGGVCRKHGPKGRRELDEVKSALTNHTSALLRLLRQTDAKGEKCIPALLADPLREETMAALRNANFRFPLLKAVIEAENEAARLYTEEIRQRGKESRQQQDLML